MKDTSVKYLEARRRHQGTTRATSAQTVNLEGLVAYQTKTFRILLTIINHHHFLDDNFQMPSAQPLPPSKPLNVVPLPVPAAQSRPPESPQARPQPPATEPQPPCRVLPPPTCHKLALPQLAHSLTWSESYQLQEVFAFPLFQDPH